MMLPSDKESKVMLARYWGADPVHLTPDGYDKLAEKLVDYINVSQTSKRPRTDSDDDHHNLRKRGIIAQLNHIGSMTRPIWVYHVIVGKFFN